MIIQKYVARDEYLDFLKRHQDKKVIKVRVVLFKSF